MAPDSPRRIVWNVAVIIGVVFMFTVEETVGQVVIKERVEITSEAAASEKSAEAQVETYLIAPFDGLLKVEYTSADRLLAPMPLSAVLEAQINGISSAVDTVVSRLSFVDSTTTYCDETFPNGYPAPAFYTRFDYTALPYPPPGKRSAAQSAASTWAVTSVAEGDSVVLTYQSPNPGDFATGLTQIDDSTWSLEGGALACYTQPIFHWSDRIEAIVRVVRDTLSLEFEPAADGFVPVPDSVVNVKARISGVPTSGTVVFGLEPHDYIDGFLLQDTVIVFKSDQSVMPKSVSLDGDSAEVELLSTAYWGVVDVTAHYILAGDTVASRTERFPADDDLDGIADVWEDSTGGLFLAGQNVDDSQYDNETTGGAKNGDGFLKIDEYTGVRIGNEHHRLRPDRLEVFYDIERADSARVAWAANELENQLNIHYQLVRGNNGKYGSWPGSRPLRWTGRLDSLGYRTGYHAVIDATSKHVPPSTPEHEQENALVIDNNRYFSNGPRIDLIPSSPCTSGPMSCQPAINRGGLELGGTPNPLGDGSSESKIYLETVANVFHKDPNSIGEAYRHRFHYLIAESSGNIEWTMEVDAITDVDSSGGLQTVNPFDHLSPITGVANNDTVSLVVGTMTEDELLKRVTLHELAHGFWIGNFDPNNACPQSKVTPGSCHPTTGNSVMRQGIGPAKTVVFSQADKALLRLH